MAPPTVTAPSSPTTAKAGYVQTVAKKSAGLADDVATRRTAATVGAKAIESAKKLPPGSVNAAKIAGPLAIAATAYTEFNNTTNVRSWLEEQGVEGEELDRATVQAGAENATKATIATVASSAAGTAATAGALSVIAGSAATGAAAGTTVGPVGTAVGTVAGIVVGVGTYVATREAAERLLPTDGEGIAERAGIDLPDEPSVA
jgi:hypothetical protein